MEIGLCLHPAKLSSLPDLPDGQGFDYIEGLVMEFLVPHKAEADFEEHRIALDHSGWHMPACNFLFPSDLKLTGREVDPARRDLHAATVFRRAQVCGIGLVVVGSGGARSAPLGYPAAAAFEQFVQVLRQLAPLAERHGLTLVVEPLQCGECNFLNTVREGAEAVRRVNRPSVLLLVDLFHMLRNGEPPEDIIAVGPLIRHAHLAENRDRAAPGVHGEDFRPYLRALRATGYDRRLTIEAVWTDLPNQLAPAIGNLRAQLRDAGY